MLLGRKNRYSENDTAATDTQCGREELPKVRGQGQRMRVLGCEGAGTA